MPINIPNDLPAARVLEEENIFFISERRARAQDIRPLRIAILNLMPKKIDTETQLLRLLGNSPLQVDVELLQTASYTAKNTPQEHLLKFYRTFEDIKEQKFDGLIITGAPIEHLSFDEVEYWRELCQIMEWSKTHVYSTFHICWGAQAGLYYHYGIEKQPLPEKMFGIFHHRPLVAGHPLLRGFDSDYLAPHSRHTQVLTADLAANPQLVVLSTSERAGLYLAASRDGRRIFCTGHSEYDTGTLDTEYRRDRDKGLPQAIPENYYLNDDQQNAPQDRWRAHANLLYANWLNYFVYQQTPFDLSRLEETLGGERHGS